MRMEQVQRIAWQHSLMLLAAASLVLACGGSSQRSRSGSAGGGGNAVAGSPGSAAQAGLGGALGSGGGAAQAGLGGALGGGGDAGGPAAIPVEPFQGTTEEYWTFVAQTARAREEECFGVPAAFGMMNSNVVSAHYLIEAELAWRLRDVQPSIDAGRVHFDRQRAAECLQRLATQSCEELRRDLALHPEGCVDDGLVGLIEPGGVCEQWVDCAGNDFACYGTGLDEPRRCTPLSGPGESCDFIGCASGNFCTPTGASNEELPWFTCVPRAPAGVGEPCGESPCAEGLYCSQRGCRAYQADMPCLVNADCPYLQVCLVEPGAPGRCGRAHDEGEPCSGSAFENDCAFSLDCRPNPQGLAVCTSVWVPVGEMCRNTGSNGGIVCIDGICAIEDAATQEGVCVPSHRLGEACYLGSCAPGLECTAEAGCQPTPY